MIRSILMAAVAGTRSMTPLAAVAIAARLGSLPDGNGAPALLARPLVSAGTALVAAGELAGDKMKSAPDRIVIAGVAARLVSGAVAAMAYSPKEKRVLAAIVGAAVATGSAHLTFRLRMLALHRYGQAASGLVEDALTLAGAAIVARTAPADAA